jgi:peptidoglycan/LPS O-acetylase OafA/YrhL
LQINRQNLKWLVRMMLILVLVGLAEILVVLFVPKPLPWVALIPVLIPLLVSFLIILPLARSEKGTRPGL